MTISPLNNSHGVNSGWPPPLSFERGFPIQRLLAESPRAWIPLGPRVLCPPSWAARLYGLQVRMEQYAIRPLSLLPAGEQEYHVFVIQVGSVLSPLLRRWNSHWQMLKKVCEKKERYGYSSASLYSLMLSLRTFMNASMSSSLWAVDKGILSNASGCR